MPLNLVFGTETNGAVPTEILVLNLIDLADGELIRCGQGGKVSILDGIECLKHADLAIHHSDYHAKWLQRLYQFKLLTPRYDTLKAAQEQMPGQSHSLASWADRLGMKVIPHVGSKIWTPTLQTRCDQNVLVVAELYKALEGVNA